MPESSKIQKNFKNPLWNQLLLGLLWSILFILKILRSYPMLNQETLPIIAMLTAGALISFGIFLALLALRSREKIIVELENQIANAVDDHVDKLGHVNRTLKQEIQIRMQLEQMLRNSLDETKQVAQKDSLTGLLNRRAITDHAKSEYFRCIEDNEPISLIMLDMDNLKKINDQYGHLAGDKAIQFLAKTLFKLMRKYDGIGRWGGDEFLIVLSNADSELSSKIANRLINEMNLISLEDIGAREIFLEISIGISTYLSKDSSKQHTPLEEIIAQADTALYEAKEKGKNQVRVFELVP